ncbi:MAG: hypothetical protein ACOZAK_00020 [Patescibacteria group bacterium]
MNPNSTNKQFIPPTQTQSFIQQPTNTTTPHITIDTNPKQILPNEPHNLKEVLEKPLIDRLITKYGHWIHEIVAWGLILQSLKSLYNSGVFILVEMPAKEIALQNHLIAQEDINSLASKIILMLLSASLSMIFGLRLRALKSGLAKKIQTTIGIVLIFTNSQLIQFLNDQNSSQFLSDLFLKFFGK